MIYTFQCTGSECDGVQDVTASIREGPPNSFLCPVCETWGMERVWHPPQLLIRGDPDDVGHGNLMADTGGMSVDRVAAGAISKGGANRKEHAYQRYIDDRRKIFKKEKQHGGRMTHQVPAELYHAKKKQTGDPDYWKDPSNLNRHSSCKVS